jgi:hypothetical protein
VSTDHFFSTSHERKSHDDRINPQTDRHKIRSNARRRPGCCCLAPATAHALPVNNEGGGCRYTDKDGYDIPIDEGQDVFVDGKIVSVAVERSSSPLCQRALAENKAD